MLLNMDGFDDNTTSIFYGANSWGTAFTTTPTSPFFPTGSDSVAGNPTMSNLHSTDQTSSPLTSAGGPVTLSSEDAQWQMYISPSLSDSLHSLDLDNLTSTDLAYPQHTLANFDEFETLESPSYQDTQTVNDDVQQKFYPLLAPQPRAIQPALLSLKSTQGTGNSLLSAQGESSTKADEHTTVYPSSESITDVGVLTARQSDTYLAQSPPPSALLSSSHGRDPTITKLVDHSSTSTRPRRGLGGWGYTNHLELPTVTSSTTMRQKPPSTSSSKSINSGLIVPDSISPSLCSSTTGGSSRTSERLLKRSRQSDESLPILKHPSKTRRVMVDTEDDSVDEDGDDGSDDSDDYKPSRSPSLDPFRRSISPSSHSIVFKSETGVESSTSVNNRRKKPRKGKGKAKGSAALALAVVSQMVRNPPAAGRRADIDLNSTRFATTGITRRKNQPIPLPIPVPNLNKKSRGRKVPHITNNDNTMMKRKTSSSSSTKVYVKKEEDVEDDGEEDGSEDEFEDRSRSSSSRSRRKKSTPEMSKTPSGENRTFICVVPGCGKCFIRSEHLKRHVRSIHTHDKREFRLFFIIIIFLSVSSNKRSSFCMVLL